MPVYPAVEALPGSPGDQIDFDGQYQFRSLLFGHGTSILVENVDGLLGTPPVTNYDSDKAHSHGSNVGLATYRKRTIAFDIKILGSPGIDIESKIEEAQETFQIPRIRNSRVLDPFVFKRAGGPKKLLWVRCEKSDFPSDFKTARGLVEGSVELIAPDPRIYALEPSQGTLTLIPGVTAGQIILTQLGKFRDGAPPIIEVSGPATNPIIENETDDGRAIRLEVVLAANDAIRVDVNNRKVWVRRGLAGDWELDYSTIRSDNEWWNLLPGNNTINYNRTGSSTASVLDVEWQSVW